MRGLLVVVVCSLLGCAGTTPEVQLGNALAIGGASLGCVEGEAPLVAQAIAQGQPDWLAIALEGLGCLPGVLKSILNAIRSERPELFKKKASTLEHAPTADPPAEP